MAKKLDINQILSELGLETDDTSEVQSGVAEPAPKSTNVRQDNYTKRVNPKYYEQILDFKLKEEDDLNAPEEEFYFEPLTEEELAQTRLGSIHDRNNTTAQTITYGDILAHKKRHRSHAMQPYKVRVTLPNVVIDRLRLEAAREQCTLDEYLQKCVFAQIDRIDKRSGLRKINSQLAKRIKRDRSREARMNTISN